MINITSGKYEITMIYVNGCENAIEIKMPMELNHIGNSLKEYIRLLLSEPQKDLAFCTEG